MRTKLTCLLILGFASILSARQFRCDYKYFAKAAGWLKLHWIPANWHEARLRCHLEGAKLASPLSAELSWAMRNLLEQEELKCGVFTGIHAFFSKGDFHSIEGIPLSKIPHVWATGEPDNYKDQESCIVMLETGELGDVNCSDPLAYMCYKKSNTDIVTDCGTTDPEYELDTRTGSCYKFHKVARTWSRAYMTCAAEGGSLVIINSETEAQIIRELFVKNPPSSMVGNFWKNVAFVGIHDWGEHGEFLTIEGQTLAQAGYAKYAPGEPNNSTTGEFCIAVYTNGLYDDLWCENPYPFICEKRPDSLRCEDGRQN